MNFGLTDSEIMSIQKILAGFSEVREARIYGSRALGTHRVNSDIDLVVYGEIDRKILGQIMGALDELELPYLFDVTVYSDISHLPFKEHIDGVSKPFPLF